MTTSCADETRQDLASMRLKVNEVLTLQRRPSRPVGHDLGNALILIDALGERITLAMQLCFSQDVRLLCTTFERTLTYN
jgi:hypothetical protein